MKMTSACDMWKKRVSQVVPLMHSWKWSKTNTTRVASIKGDSSWNTVCVLWRGIHELILHVSHIATYSTSNDQTFSDITGLKTTGTYNVAFKSVRFRGADNVICFLANYKYRCSFTAQYVECQYVTVTFSSVQTLPVMFIVQQPFIYDRYCNNILYVVFKGF